MKSQHDHNSLEAIAERAGCFEYGANDDIWQLKAAVKAYNRIHAEILPYPEAAPEPANLSSKLSRL